ncbi:MAG: ABC transporter transmembrane domain-containing protein, partial [Candidatus Uhrbacteria bacterium]
MFEFWTKYWQLIKPYRHAFIKSLVLVGIVQAIMLIDPYLFKLILDEFQNWSSNSFYTIIGLIVAVMVAGIITTGIVNLRQRAIFKAMLTLERELPTRCLEKLTTLSYGYHVRKNTGAKIGQISRGTNRAMEIAADFMFMVAPVIFEVVFVSAVMFVLNWIVAVIFLAIIPFYLLQIRYTERRIGPMRRVRYDRYEKADHLMTQAVINIQSVQSFVQERREYQTYYSLKKKIFSDELAEWLWQINFDW